MQISPLAKEKCRDNMSVIGGLMAAFKKHQYTIQRWFDENNEMLTTKKAIEVITTETGLSESEIFEEQKASA